MSYEIELYVPVYVEITNVWPKVGGGYEFEYRVSPLTEADLKDKIEQQAPEILEDIVYEFSNGGN